MARSAEFDLALLDVNVGGARTADHLFELLWCNGYSSAVGDRPLLRKPFLPETLAKAIDKAMSAHKA